MNSQLRFNPLKGEWVLFSPKRHDSKKPKDVFVKNHIKSSEKKCPFENFEATGNLPPYFRIPDSKKDWKVMVFPNKFPGLDSDIKNRKGIKLKLKETMPGYGYHDLLITRDHNRHFSDCSDSELNLVFSALQKRYEQVSDDPNIDYVAIFQNKGPSVGASLFHPHIQILSLPILPSHIARELRYSYDYFKKNHSCLYCDIIKSEKKDGVRIIYENKNIIAFVPYAAQEPYEVLLFPKKHEMFFEKSSGIIIDDLSNAFGKVLSSIKKKLNDPDYNFYIHTAPATNGGSYKYHHWYIRILPKSNDSAGFELGTGIEMNTVFPEDAARILRIKKKKGIRD